jgi:hypothetical protein
MGFKVGHRGLPYSTTCVLRERGPGRR